MIDAGTGALLLLLDQSRTQVIHQRQAQQSLTGMPSQKELTVRLHTGVSGRLEQVHHAEAGTVFFVGEGTGMRNFDNVFEVERAI